MNIFNGVVGGEYMPLNIFDYVFTSDTKYCEYDIGILRLH